MCHFFFLRMAIGVVLCILPVILAQHIYDSDDLDNDVYVDGDQEPLYLFEGDIIGYRPITGALYSGTTKSENIWTGGTVPYEISGRYSAEEKQVILGAIGDFARKTCINFRPKNFKDRYSVYIAPKHPGKCFTFWGRQTHAQLEDINRRYGLRMDKKQLINLAHDGCVSHGTTQHELMHAVGFLHEQARHDRDDYVEILLHNIKLGDRDQFQKETETDPQGTPYDFGSVMHYAKDAFSKNGQDTIRPRPTYRGKTLGQREGLSPLDIQKINRLYSKQCGRSSPAPAPEPDNGSGQVVTYIVKDGDTLSKIAVQLGKSWPNIARDNKLANPDFISPGQVLIIK